MEGGGKMLKRKVARISASLAAAGALALSAGAAPASAAPGVVSGGVVNVTVVDAVDINNNTVQVPIGIGVNVCGIQANVLAQMISQGQSVDCDATNNQLPVAFRR
jgi:hypothetical protein